MKLVHQINLAFLAVLLVVLTVSSIIIHYVLLDHFMATEAQNIQTLGATMTVSLSKAAMSPVTTATAVGATTNLPAVATGAVNGVQAIITDKSGNIISGSIPSAITLPATQLQVAAVQPSNLTNIWEGRDSRFLVAVNPIPQGTLTLISPISRIKGVEQALLKQLLLVICIGGVLMFLLSLVITRRLIKPLMALKEELTKVKGRHYSEVKHIRAGGEIGIVAEAVFELATELERYSRAQKQFFQNASHELKTPLMSISGYAEGIRDGVFEGEDVPKGLDIIVSESGRLKNIVTEMTLLAKLDSEADIFRPVQVCVQDILTETIERINPLVVKKGLELMIVCPPGDKQRLVLNADRDKLLQALLNIVSNATRYASKQIRIQVGINKEQIEITISDDGAGIPADVLPYLFHRFVKGSDGDTGLGLAISRAIVERCGGLISAGNGERGGAVVSLSFPVVTGIQ